MPVRSLQQGYILHVRPFGETSAVLELVTDEGMRLAVLAKGGRKPTKGKSPLVPWQEWSMAWRGRGELPTLTHLEPVGPNLLLSGVSLFCGLYFNELVMRLCPRGMGEPELYSLYRDALVTLGRIDSGQGRKNSAGDIAVLARRFELDMLRMMGQCPDLSACAVCHAPAEGDAAWAMISGSGLRCPDHAEGNGYTLAGHQWRSLGEGKPCSDPEVLSVLQGWLESEFNYLFDQRGVVSRSTLRSYWRLTRNGVS